MKKSYSKNIFLTILILANIIFIGSKFYSKKEKESPTLKITDIDDEKIDHLTEVCPIYSNPEHQLKKMQEQVNENGQKARIIYYQNGIFYPETFINAKKAEDINYKYLLENYTLKKEFVIDHEKYYLYMANDFCKDYVGEEIFVTYYQNSDGEYLGNKAQVLSRKK